MEKFQKSHTPIWKLQLRFAKSQENFYFETVFADWEQRIHESHQKEIVRIEREYESAILDLTPDIEQAGYDPDEIFGEQYSEENDLKNSMYASLIVALWSHMESKLKELASISILASGKLKPPLKDLSDAYEKILDGKSPNSEDLNKNACEVVKYSKKAWKFKEIRDVFNKTLDKKIAKHCASYHKLDFTRLLCNAFKHNDGICDDISYSSMNIELRNSANIISLNAIDYCAVDIQVLVDGCRDTINWIILEIENIA